MKRGKIEMKISPRVVEEMSKAVAKEEVGQLRMVARERCRAPSLIQTSKGVEKGGRMMTSNLEKFFSSNKKETGRTQTKEKEEEGAKIETMITGTKDTLRNIFLHVFAGPATDTPTTRGRTGGTTWI